MAKTWASIDNTSLPFPADFPICPFCESRDIKSDRRWSWDGGADAVPIRQRESNYTREDVYPYVSAESFFCDECRRELGKVDLGEQKIVVYLSTIKEEQHYDNVDVAAEDATKRH